MNFNLVSEADSQQAHVFKDIWSNTTKGLFTEIVILELQKVFDTLHVILCNKPSAIGVAFEPS